MKFKCTYVKHKAFNYASQTWACNTLIDYPDINEQFEIHNDDSNLKF